MKTIAVLLIAWFGLLASQPVAAAVPAHALPTYAYDGHRLHADVSAHPITERGPPFVCADARAQAAADLGSHGTIARQDSLDSRIHAPYATTNLVALGITATGTTSGHAAVVDGGRRALQRLQVAAKGAGEAGALVRYDAQAASRNLLGQVGEGYARTPSGYTVSAHAAERIVYGAPGRSPTTLGRVDDILKNPTRSVMRPDGSIRVFQGKDWVAVRGSGPIHIITVMVR